MKSGGTFLVGIGLVLVSPAAFAQSTTSALIGSVTDSTGAFVAGATVTVINAATGVSSSVTDDSQGTYRVSQLPPGTYSIKVSAAGFQSYDISALTLQLDQQARQDVTLSVGESTQTVEVLGTTPLLDTATSNIGQVITPRQIQDLPLNGRDFLQLATLSAGVSPIAPGVSSPASTWTGTSVVSLSIAGLREDDVSYLYDGIETRNGWYGAAGLLPSIDNIQEFKVEQTGSSAAYGDAGAFINVVTKSGTNNLHGTIYEFLRNNALDTRNYFDVGAPPAFHQNQFGASLGGRIRRNKMFYFLNYEGFRQTEPHDSLNTVPTAAELAGNFSALPQQLYNPFTGAPYAGNIIPSTSFSTVGQKLLSYYPAPNGVFPGGSNFLAVTNTTDNWDQGSGRIDYTVSSRDSVFARYTQQEQNTVLGGITIYNSQSFPTNPKSLATGWTHIVSPTLVNNFRFGYTHTETGETRAFGFDTTYANPVGLKNVGLQPGSYGLPRLSISGYANPGGANGTEVIREGLFMWTDGISMQKGRHTVTAGLDIRYDPTYLYEDWQGTNLSFNGAYTGNSIADLLVGVPSAGGSADGDPTLNLRRWYQAYYVQDNFQVNHRLNVNGGIRYEYAAPPVDTRNHVGSFDFATGTELTYPDTNVLGLGRQMVHPQHTNFSPRLGFNYLPFSAGNTSVKGGFGLYFLQTNLNQYEVEVDTPKYYSVSFYNNSPKGQPVAFTADQLFSPALAGTNPGSGQSVSFENPNNATPYTYEWSLAIQQTFLRNWLLEVTYLGSAAHHFEQRIISNPLQPNDTTRFPLYPGGAQENLNEGSSIYNGVTARVEKQYSSGFSLLGTYTYSKCLSDPWQDQFTWHPLNTKLDRGHCADDLNQRLSLTSIYELPFGRGKPLLDRGGVVNQAVGGWQVSAIGSFYSGPWFTLSSNQNLGNFINALPNVTGPVNSSSLRKGLGKNGRVGPYFNVQNVQAVTTLGVQGNAGVQNIRGPGAQNWDLALFKTFTHAERYKLTFRTDFFNAFNHANFTGLVTNVNATNFGDVSSALPGREIQFSLRAAF